MVDWTKTMQQSFEYYTVDPGTWKNVKKLDMITACNIERDYETDTLESATFDVTKSLDECYIRVYLVTIQNGITEKHPLGTFLVQSPSTNFNGKVQSISLDGYSPLLEVKEKKPELGYSLLEGDNILEKAYIKLRECTRAPVIRTECDEKLQNDFVANLDDTWIIFLQDLVNNAKYEISLDELSRILFTPKQDASSMRAKWTFNDDNSSILLPDISMDRDLYGIPNVVEIIYSSGRRYYVGRAVNDNPNSPISIVNRGREIIHREVNPSLGGLASETQVKIYAEQKLKTLSTLEYTVSYSHGYCPVRLADCVRLNYKRAGIEGVKAKIINQSIRCDTGCTVTDKAIFTSNLWR